MGRILVRVRERDLSTKTLLPWVTPWWGSWGDPADVRPRSITACGRTETQLSLRRTVSFLEIVFVGRCEVFVCL